MIVMDNFNDTEEIQRLDASTIARLAQDLNRRLADTSIILSCEGWLFRSDEFAALNLLRNIHAPAEIFVMVRGYGASADVKLVASKQ